MIHFCPWLHIQKEQSLLLESTVGLSWACAAWGQVNTVWLEPSQTKDDCMWQYLLIEVPKRWSCVALWDRFKDPRSQSLERTKTVGDKSVTVSHIRDDCHCDFCYDLHVLTSHLKCHMKRDADQCDARLHCLQLLQCRWTTHAEDTVFLYLLGL